MGDIQYIVIKNFFCPFRRENRTILSIKTEKSEELFNAPHSFVLFIIFLNGRLPGDIAGSVIAG